jgi:hypothetical protein
MMVGVELGVAVRVSVGNGVKVVVIVLVGNCVFIGEQLAITTPKINPMTNPEILK